MRSNSGSMFPLVLIGVIVAAAGCGESRQALATRGLDKLRDGDYKGAALILGQASAKDPSNANLQYHLGIALLNIGSTENAVNCMKKAAELAPSDPAPHEILCQVAMKARKWDQARASIAHADHVAHGVPRILNAMGVVEIQSGDAQKALSCLNSAIEADPAYAPAYFNLGVLNRDRLVNREAAAQYFKKYLQYDPSGARASVARDFLKTATDKPHKASPAEPVLSKARAALKNENYDEALEFYNDAMKKDPSNPDALWELSGVYEKIRNNVKAFDSYRLFKKQFPNDPRAPQAQKKIAEFGTKPADVKGAKGTAAVLSTPAAKPEAPKIADPSSAKTSKDAFAEAFKRQTAGDVDGAIAFYCRACQLEPSSSDSFFNLGLLYRQKGDLENARESFGSAAQLKPKTASFRYMLALTYRDLKNNAKAIEELNRILRAQPDFADAYYVLGSIYTDEKRPDTAKSYFDKYNELKKKQTLITAQMDINWPSPNLADIIALGIILTCAVRGFMRGLSGEMGRLVGVIITVVLAIVFHGRFAAWMMHNTRLREEMATALSFVTIILGGLLVILIINLIVKAMSKSSDKAKPADKAWGGFVGLVRGSILVLALFIAFNLWPSAYLKKTFGEKSIIGAGLQRVMPWIQERAKEDVEQSVEPIRGSDEIRKAEELLDKPASSQSAVDDEKPADNGKKADGRNRNTRRWRE